MGAIGLFCPTFSFEYYPAVPQLFHFSENPAISVFRPRSAPVLGGESLVWAIDLEHSPSYWFPRDCPRACCWVGESPIRHSLLDLPGIADLQRLHVIEEEWLDRMLTCRLYAYEFDPEGFESRVAEAGYWASPDAVIPLAVAPAGDLVSRHVESGIELRAVPNLWPWIDAIVDSGLEFSIIRKANARPR
jgi:hypothetical protein